MENVNPESQDGEICAVALENTEDSLENLEYKIPLVMLDYKKGLRATKNLKSLNIHNSMILFK